MIKSRLKVVLAEKDMTQKQLAEITGIRQPTISAMCNNSLRRVPIDVMEKICDALECQPGDIFRRSEE